MPAETLRALRPMLVVLAAAIAEASSASAQSPAESTRAASSAPAGDAALRSYFAANGLLNRGLYDAAADEYRSFLSQHADHAKANAARYGLAVCLFRGSKYEAADEALTPLAGERGFQFAAEVGVMRGQCALAAARCDDAAKVFAAVLRDHAGHELADDAAAGAVEALYRAGRTEESLQRADAALSRWPDSPLRSRIAYFAALSAAARDDGPNAADRLERLLRDDPSGPYAAGAALLLAQCRQRLGAPAEAANLYERLIEQGDRAVVPDATVGLATVRLEQGKAEEAGRLLDAYLTQNGDGPRAAEARLARGRAYLEQKDYRAAAKVFRELSRGEGELADDAAWWLGKCLMRQERYADAAQALESAIKRFPRSRMLPEMCYERGAALYRAGEDAAAALALTEFRRRFADHALAADALQLLAAVEHRRRRYDECAAACQTFLKDYPSHDLTPSIRFLAAETDFLAGRPAEAVDGFRRYLSDETEGKQAAAARFRLGTALFQLGRLEEAEPLLAQAAESGRSGDSFDASLLGLGDLYFQRGDWTRAEQSFARYLEQGADRPGAADAMLKLGIALQRLDRHAEAIDAFDRLMSRVTGRPQAVQAAFERGQSLAALKRGTEAAEAFESVLKLEGAERFAPFALNHLAALASARGDSAAAVGYYDRLLKTDAADDLKATAAYERARALFAARQYEPAAAALAEFARTHPDDDRSAVCRAQRAVALSRLDHGAEALQAIAAVEKAGLDRLPPDLRTAVQYEKAWRLRGSDKPDAAAAEYRRVAESADDPALRLHALAELAALESAAGRWNEAAAACEQVRALCANQPSAATAEIEAQAAYLLGVSEFERQRFEPAAAVMEELIERFPDDRLVGSACYYAGESLFRAGRFDRAARCLARVCEKDRAATACGPSLLRLGECLAQLQQWPRSEKAFAEYLERFGDSADAFQAMFGLGWARENQKRFAEAISAYRGVTEKHRGPTAARAQFQIGECLFATKKYEEAVRELLKVDILYAYPEWSAAAVFEAGRCLEQLDQRDQAREQFRFVAEKHGGTRWGAMAAERLKQLAGGELPGRAGASSGAGRMPVRTASGSDAAAENE